MATTATGTSWQISGDYFETCSCEYLCPCIFTNLAGAPTTGHCDFALVFHVERGRYGDTTLDGLNFAALGYTPGVMGAGNGSVGLILDERADTAQQQALTAIATGQAGGPMAALAPVLSTFHGVQVLPITFEKSGLRRSVAIPGVLDQAAEGVASPIREGEMLQIDNTLHPANPRLGLAKALRSHLHAIGRDWDDDSGRNNGHIAPFDWQGAGA